MNYAPLILMAGLTCLAVNKTTFAGPNTTVRPAPIVEPCTKYCILPPKKYDHPYTGKLIIETATRDELKEFCAGSYMAGVTLGCARPSDNSCHIVLLSDEIIIARGWSRELMLRHEIGHCNGWPGDHPGLRRFDADKK